MSIISTQKPTNDSIRRPNTSINFDQLTNQVFGGQEERFWPTYYEDHFGVRDKTKRTSMRKLDLYSKDEPDCFRSDNGQIYDFDQDVKDVMSSQKMGKSIVVPGFTLMLSLRDQRRPPSLTSHQESLASIDSNVPQVTRNQRTQRVPTSSTGGFKLYVTKCKGGVQLTVTTANTGIGMRTVSYRR